MPVEQFETDLQVGTRAIEAYSRLSYTMWYALAEFIDNSTQSRLNYDNIIDDVLLGEGTPLVVEIEHNRIQRYLRIKDNSIGMTKDDLVEALRIAHPTKDSRGRSRYGMGMKTAACWIGKKWQVKTCEWGSGEEWTAEIDIRAIVEDGAKIPITKREVGTEQHYTEIFITNMHRNIQKRTEETIRYYLGSIYRFDLSEERLKLLYNGEPIPAFDEYQFDTDPTGKPMKRDLPLKEIGDKRITGWCGVLRKGGRRLGGFSLFQNRRQIQGYPHAWKPKSIFGGVEDEGANNLTSQRLVALVELEGFEVSHTKDAILFEGDEEDVLEKYLEEQTRDYRTYAQRRRGPRGQPWTREKIRDLVESMKTEFTSDEMKDALNTSILPPIDTIASNNQKQVENLTGEETVAEFVVLPNVLRVIVSLVEKSEYEPHLNISAGAEAGTIHVVVNGLHPYYASLESTDAIDECLRQYIYDAISEYRVSALNAIVTPNSVRRLKNDLLRVPDLRVQNAATAAQKGELEAILGSKPEN